MVIKLKLRPFGRSWGVSRRGLFPGVVEPFFILFEGFDDVSYNSGVMRRKPKYPWRGRAEHLALAQVADIVLSELNLFKRPFLPRCARLNSLLHSGRKWFCEYSNDFSNHWVSSSRTTSNVVLLLYTIQSKLSKTMRREACLGVLMLQYTYDNYGDRNTLRGKYVHN